MLGIRRYSLFAATRSVTPYLVLYKSSCLRRDWPLDFWLGYLALYIYISIYIKTPILSRNASIISLHALKYRNLIGQVFFEGRTWEGPLSGPPSLSPERALRRAVSGAQKTHPNCSQKLDKNSQQFLFPAFHTILCSLSDQRQGNPIPSPFSPISNTHSVELDLYIRFANLSTLSFSNSFCDRLPRHPRVPFAVSNSQQAAFPPFHISWITRIFERSFLSSPCRPSTDVFLYALHNAPLNTP